MKRILPLVLVLVVAVPAAAQSIAASISAPFTLNAPTDLGFGRHTVTVLAHDAGTTTVDRTITVDVGDTEDPHPHTNPSYELGGCSAGTSPGQPVWLIVIGMLVVRRRRWWW